MTDSIMQKLAICGPFFSGDSGPSLDLILTYDSGGYVDITHSDVEVGIRRWDAVARKPIGPNIASGPAFIIDGLNGEAQFKWIYADPIANVPSDPGWYVLQATVILADGTQQLSQKAIFEVIS